MTLALVIEQENESVNDWQTAHAELSRFARKRAGLEVEEGRLLLNALRTRAHTELGFSTFSEYIERLFGYSHRVTLEKLRVAEALETLPALSQALGCGELRSSALRELTRVATHETEDAWLHAARGLAAREIERLVSGHRLGDLPSDPPKPELKRHVLRFEISGETLGLFRDALARLRRASSGPLDDDAALLLMARHVLGGPQDEGRASYQIRLYVCEQCGRGEQLGRGELLPIAPEIVRMAECDAQRLGRAPSGLTHVGTPEAPKRATQAIPPATRRFVMHRDHERCVVPGCRNATFLDVHHIRSREAGGGHEPENLCCLCGAYHRAVHRGRLFLSGSPSAGLSFRHSSGSAYGQTAELFADPGDVDAQILRALNGLGFRARESAHALAQVRSSQPASLSREALLKAAVGMLTRTRLVAAGFE